MPPARRIVKRDERRDRAESGRGEREAGSVRQHAREHARVAHSLAMHERHGSRPARETVADCGQRDRDGAERPRTERVGKGRAGRRADRDRAVVCYAIPRDHARALGGTDAPDAPQNRSGADIAFAETEHETSERENRQAQHGPTGAADRGQKEHAAHAAGRKPGEHRALRAARIGAAARMRTRGQRRDVLEADRRAGEHGAEPELAVDEAGQHGKRNANDQVADEREKDDFDDLPGCGDAGRS